jgi:hypothetical protein
VASVLMVDSIFLTKLIIVRIRRPGKRADRSTCFGFTVAILGHIGSRKAPSHDSQLKVVGLNRSRGRGGFDPASVERKGIDLSERAS